MNCRDREDLITRYASGELFGASRRELEAHLRGCPRCRGELALARSLEETLENLVPASLPDGVGVQVMAAVDRLDRQVLHSELQEIARGRRRLLNLRRDLPILVSIAAAVCLVAIALADGWPFVFRVLSHAVPAAFWTSLLGMIRPPAEESTVDVNAVVALLTLAYALFIGAGLPYVGKPHRPLLPF
jgi:anti-sigma factor RsiW